VGNSHDRNQERPIKTGDQPDQRSSGEEAAQREQKQQEADAKNRSGRSQSRKGGRDQDDGGQSGITGRDQNSR